MENFTAVQNFHIVEVQDKLKILGGAPVDAGTNDFSVKMAVYNFFTLLLTIYFTSFILELGRNN